MKLTEVNFQNCKGQDCIQSLSFHLLSLFISKVVEVLIQTSSGHSWSKAELCYPPGPSCSKGG